jgi:hypothetical protein
MITCEYPPQTGGVSDYSHGVAAGLAAEGDEVHVWCPACPGEAPATDGVTLHREFGSFTKEDLGRVGRQLDQYPGPRRILVQWVPHGYGLRSMNIVFCWWLRQRVAGHHDAVEIFVHEPYLPFGRNWKQSAAALVHRLMTIVLLQTAERVWMSIPEWERCLKPYALGRPVPFQWLPIPNNIPMADDPAATRLIRQRYAPGDTLLIGHFGTHGSNVTSLLTPILSSLGGDAAKQKILLMGLGSDAYREQLIRSEPRLTEVVEATGPLPARDLSCHVAACDLLIQPYPDGVSTRRTSFMIGLCHGQPMVTTTGVLTEPFWRETGAVEMATAGDVNSFVDLVRRLRTDAGARARIGRTAQTLYRTRFEISHTIEALRHTNSRQVES